MSSLDIGLISAAFLLGGLGVGLLLAHYLPESHLNEQSKHTIQVASGMLATLAALVLGLLVASAKNSFDTIQTANTVTGANFIILSRGLEEYGPEAQPVREDLRKAVASEIQSIWPEESPSMYGQPPLEKSGSLKQALRDLSALHPATDEQRLLIDQMRQILFSCVQARWLLIEESEEEVPTALYVLLIGWLTLLFIGFGLFAPRNITVLVSLILCACSVATAIFLFDEMNSPLDGIIKVSSAPMQKALSHLEREQEED
jgi:hypothetical protein